MMIKSTNQVGQMFVADKSVAIKKLLDREGGKPKGFNLVIDDDVTDFVTKGQILDINVKKADEPSEKMLRKALCIKLNADVNGGAPVAGQDYIIALRFRGDIGEEDAMEKVAMAHCYAGDFTTTITDNAEEAEKDKIKNAKKALYKRLAQSFIDNASCDYTPFYLVTDKTGVEITDVTTITEDGFYLVEQLPYWRLGTFKESLAKIDVMTRPIILDSDEIEDWLDERKFTARPEAMAANVPAILNSHKVADMEYFYKGERGVSAFMNHPYDIQIPVKLKVDPEFADGYDILTLHYFYAGANASNQKSEKDIIIAVKHDVTLTGDITTIDALKTAIEAV